MFLAASLLVFSHFLGAFCTSNGLTDVVTWDPFSLSVNGERVFIYSGEFHYPRLPVPELWTDVFQKFKANGLNAVSLYFFWSYHSAAKGAFDFESPGKDVQKVLDAAKDAGLYVIARPGPYVNAETNGGGFALWGSDGSAGKLRTSDETFHQAWLPWMNEINAILARNQINQGGNVILEQIENELSETSHSASNTLVLYMEQLENATRSSGIVIPFSSNEKGERAQSWSTDYEDVGGAVNVYGLDSYPGGFSCTNINSGFNLVRNYYQWFQNYSFTQPEYLPEFEGGYLLGWGGAFYDTCLAEHDPAFADVYYKNNVGQKVTLQSIYMAFGGTNWGNLAAPVVYTSYDYSAPLRETREIQPKFSQTKLIGLFTRVSTDLLTTVMESNGTGNAVDSASIWTWVLRNPNTKAGFYVLQHDTSSSRDVTDFSVDLKTSAGALTVPNVQLNGRQSKIVVTDYSVGNITLLYSTADVLTYGIFDESSVLVLYLEPGQVGEFAFKGVQYANASVATWGSTTVNVSSSADRKTVPSYTKYTYTQGAGTTAVKLRNGLLVYLLDISTAWAFFAPPTTKNPNVKANEQIFVIGPYLVREASVQGSTVSVFGDNANDTTIEVHAGQNVDQIYWNNRSLPTTQTAYGALTAALPGVKNYTIHLPILENWQVADSLPEKSPNYNDSAWRICNKTSTLAPVAPLSLPVLYSSDYGYYAGNKIYRGYFDGTSATAINITAQNGLASGWSAWVNGVFVGGSTGNISLSATRALLDLSKTKLQAKNNVLTVVTDYTGHDETSTGSGVENPRGLLGAMLYAGNTTQNFTTWKIQGNAGGDANIDPVRGPLNEGGLYGERLGWHLPGFMPSSPTFSSGSPAQGLNQSGIAWYVTEFELDIPGNLDVPLGIELGSPNGTQASVQLYINGYQYGKYIPQIGPQTRFPAPPGIINNQGKNTLAISLWAQTDSGARLTTVSLFKYGVYESSMDFAQDWSYLQPQWTEDRLQYA